MSKGCQFIRSLGTVKVLISNSCEIDLPVYLGILKHLNRDQLFIMLKKIEVAEKYTQEAIRIAPWQALREFPVDWLKQEIARSTVRESRKQALMFLLD